MRTKKSNSIGLAVALLFLSLGQQTRAQEDDIDERQDVTASAIKLPISSSQASLNQILIPQSTVVAGKRLQTPHNVSIDDFNNCPPEGGATTDAKAASNRLKNRWSVPSDTDIDSSITLGKLLEQADDVGRFDANTAVRIKGYFATVKKSGGGESCNCKATDNENTDTHIDMTSSNSTDALKPENHLIVEVTPRTRFIAGLNGLDWSHGNLKNYEGTCLEIEGYLFYDDAHIGQARNNPSAGSNIWRATLWEVHPVTSIQEIDCSQLF